MTGWLIAFLLFGALLILRVGGDYIYTRRKNRYTIEKEISEAKTEDELIDLRIKANGDKELVERIDRKLDNIIEP
jgi:uncharacterized protein YpiB (UPF0302 family)